MFFDVDQTLCDFEAMMVRALTASIVEMEHRWPQLSRYTPDDLVRLRDEIAATYPPPVPNVAVRRQMYATLLADLADDAEIDQVTDHFLQVRYAEPIIFDDVRPALEALAEHARLGVISNGNSKLSALELEPYFEHEFLAEEIGYAKPDRRIYDHVAAQVGAEPSAMIMVGDSYANDVEAARAAGWSGIWLRRDVTGATEGTVRSLLGLPAVLRDSGRRRQSTGDPRKDRSLTAVDVEMP